MDKIYYNGNFRTLDASIPLAEAVAVSKGVIASIGSSEEILALAGKNTEKIDLKGNPVLPGFSDSHLHLIYYANTKRKVDLSRAGSVEDVISLCREGLEKIPRDNGWLLGWGWNQDYWKNQVFPTRLDLDKISTEVPIAITRACYHATIVNTKALELLDLTRNIPELGNGIVETDRSGKANGILRESAQNLVWNSVGVPELEDLKQRISGACCDAAAAGITALQTDDFETFTGDTAELIIRAYRELAAEEKLPVRIYQQCLLRTPEKLKAFLDKGYKTGREFGTYKIGPLKLLNDGSLGARTAYMSKPYRDAPDTRGVALYEPEDLTAMIKLANDSGMQIAVHCIGDAAIKMASDSFAQVSAQNPRPDLRNGIVHCQITDMDMIDRIKDLGLLVYAQPIFIRYDRHIVENRVGAGLGSTSYNWRALVDRGVHLSIGSDCPVEKFDVMPNLYCAVTGKNPDNAAEPPWHPENCLTVDEAVRSFTMEGAYAAFQEKERGTLSVGKYADFVVLDSDPYQVEPEAILNIGVVMTIVNGGVKFARV
jgi:predicted amidohydrolase YtcJ